MPRRFALLRRALAAAAVAACVAGFAAACRRKPPLTTNLSVENKVAVRPITLYFENPDMLLGPEQRNVALPENPAGALSVVARELLKGSSNAGVPKIFPADTVVRAAFLLPDGTAFVDLGGATLTNGWGTGSHEELMAVYSVVQTIVANFPEAKRVRILVNGEPAETLAGHISLHGALTPMPTLVSGAVYTRPQLPPPPPPLPSQPAVTDTTVPAAAPR